jgi:hypothetical protein
MSFSSRKLVVASVAALCTVGVVSTGWTVAAEAQGPTIDATVGAPLSAPAGTDITLNVNVYNTSGVLPQSLTLDVSPGPGAVLLDPQCTPAAGNLWRCAEVLLGNQTNDAWQLTVLTSSARAGTRQTISVGTYTNLTGTPPTLSSNLVTDTVSLTAPQTPAYELVAADGGVFPFGTQFRGSLGDVRLNAPIVAAASTVDGQGYYLLGADGGVFEFGDAPFFGSGVGLISGRAVGIAVPSFDTYDLVTDAGVVWQFSATASPRVIFEPGLAISQPIVGISAGPQGTWLVAGDGGVFPIGSSFYGSEGGSVLPHQIVGINGATGGYRLVDSAGNIYAFGAAANEGGTGNVRLNRPIVAVAGDRATDGYWLAASDGGVFPFGAPFLGSLGNVHLNQPVVAVVAGGPESITCTSAYCSLG